MKKYIYAMAIPKKEARAKIESYGDMIHRHIIECVVYSHDEYSVNHWVNELSAWMHKISTIKCKSTLTKQDYMECLFGRFGDEISDATWDLEDYLSSSLRKSNYPEFEVTDKLSKRLFDIYQLFTSTALPLLLSGKSLLYEDWQIVLKDIFKEK